MKTLVYLTLAVSAIASPALAFAQSSPTRAQVEAELARLERAGYDPSAGENVNYPADIQAAEAKIAAQDAGRTAAVGGTGSGGETGNAVADARSNEAMSADSMGADMSGSSASGSRKPAHHRPGNECVGPASFCVPYFGG
ncbi:DUF4148 domain-containing protein [Paraburkholderia solisilvae]|uniref:DUF4148 domain-containing protein n=1 Tax=Paraburkholderia solisilvae TaxID=624376 RepID=A0A6J5DFT3_9BURK|nr:hypothetical protein LMG29739_01477 [Paraburkholderia solisilvae]